MSPVEWAVGAAIVLGVIVCVSLLLFAVEDAIIASLTPPSDEPCRILVDAHGLRCATHAQRVTHFQTCTGNK